MGRVNGRTGPTPTFLVVGAARSGTTAVTEGLKTHPKVFVTQPKEPHYFAFHGQTVNFRGPGDEAAINRVAITDRGQYLALYPPASSYSALGDGSVTTLYYAEHAADEIRRVNPDVRIVVLLREPTERAFSSFNYLRARKVEEESDFLRALEREPQRIRSHWHHMWHYSGVSHYSKSLKILRDTFGADQVRVWFYDDLTRDYSSTLREVMAFIGLADGAEHEVSLPRVNASGMPRLGAAQDVVLWATRHQKVRAAVKSVVGFRTRERIRSSLLRTVSMPDEVRTCVGDRFTDDLVELSSMLGGRGPSWLPQLPKPRSQTRRLAANERP